jgi:hypothetical protein
VFLANTYLIRSLSYPENPSDSKFWDVHEPRVSSSLPERRKSLNPFSWS